jgi:arylsulfatase
VIKGPWKALWLSTPYGPTPRAWSLFDLRTDRAETNDVSQKYPEILSQLDSEWTRYASDNGVVLTE